MLTKPWKMIIVMTKAKPLIATNPPSLLVAIQSILCPTMTHHHVIPSADLSIDLTLVSTMIPVCHVLVSNVVSPKILTQSNGLSATCTTPPLVPKLPKILRCYIRLQTLLNLMHLQPLLSTVLICHHVEFLILTLPPHWQCSTLLKTL